MPENRRPGIEKLLGGARETLGPEFDAAWGEGEALRLDELPALAGC